MTVTYLRDNGRREIRFPKSSNYVHDGPSSKVLGYHDSNSGPANGLSARTGDAGEKCVLGHGRVVFVMYLSVKGFFFFFFEEGGTHGIPELAFLLNRVYFVGDVDEYTTAHLSISAQSNAQSPSKCKKKIMSSKIVFVIETRMFGSPVKRLHVVRRSPLRVADFGRRTREPLRTYSNRKS